MKKILLLAAIISLISCSKEDNCGEIIGKRWVNQKNHSSGMRYNVRFESVGINQEHFSSDTTLVKGDEYCKN